MFTTFANLPEIYKGIFFIISGTILLLWILGIATFLLVMLIKKNQKGQ